MCILVHEILVIGMGKIMEKKKKEEKGNCVCIQSSFTNWPDPK